MTYPNYNTNGTKIETLGLNQSEIDVSNLSAGVYLVKIYSKNAVETKRLIKQ